MEARPIYHYDSNIVIEMKAMSGNSLYFPDPSCDEYDKIVREYNRKVAEISFLLNRYSYSSTTSSTTTTTILEEEITNQEDLKKTLLSPAYIKNLEHLKNSFNKSFYKNKELLTLNSDDVYKKFLELASSFSELPFENAVVELTKSQSIKFTFLFDDDKLLLISKNIENNDDLNYNEIVFSLFINKELIISNVSESISFVEGFQKFLYL